MLTIDCAGECLTLLPEKAIFWPRQKSIIVADLHLGKAASFRQAGVGVPESTTTTDLARLTRILAATASERLIVLGDFFHAAAGRQPEMMDAVEAWRRKHSNTRLQLVPGNHDKKSGSPPADWNIETVPDGHPEMPFAFCHEPKDLAGYYVLSGHIHPAVSLRERFGSGIRAPCFHFRSGHAVLPAFGSFTGMHSVNPTSEDRVYAVGNDVVLEVTRRAGRLPRLQLEK